MSEQREDDDEPGGEVVPLRPVPDAELELPAERDRTVIYADITSAGDRRPVIPVHLQLANIRATVALWAGLQWHRSRYHGFRLPLYVLAVVVWAVIGAGRLTLKHLHWAWLLEQHTLRSEAVAAGDSQEWGVRCTRR